ncbi:MAG TPA: PIN domain-containing protein [Blastocatellia bacterium]|nr:PIN domain-containing protein [Blastocatellia bacterium]HMV86196.1 PIN domain-containing protein [Blastocatellia bacterium]HMX27757.1 PIN domain-containing protein [Blastocatellia bacterium]HMY70977.1 PIN domain-containing protein [Blastocatellia bacterium]HMZ18640.1 PIN domain-containing protein [Blastocatellia bacterium]
MLNAAVIIDAGPLAALVHDRDQYHAWVRQQASQLKAPFLTCDAVLSETWFLLRNLPKAQDKLLALWQQGLIRSDFDSASETDKLIELLRKYANVPMSFADACLLRMSELQANSVVFTADSDFLIYRQNRNQTIHQVFPQQP